VRHAPLTRVVLAGPESTGKTTLAADLAGHFHTVWVPEYLRDWVDAHGLPRSAADLAAVARGQRALEVRLARAAHRVLFCDTDARQTAMYSRLYFGEVSPEVARLAATSHAHLYLVLDADVPWIPDPQRDMAHRREEIRDRCLAELAAAGEPHLLVRGSWAERLTLAVAAVETLLER
jgi:NadR type nicotinamide-nucleotide adenylyltransferase